jgi:hypothetical protein
MLKPPLAVNSPMHNTPTTVTDESKDDKRWSIRALIVDDDVPIRELMIDSTFTPAASPTARRCARRCRANISTSSSST